MMRVLISEHLSTFVALFGPTVRLRPKHHFLVHFPTILLQSGPLVGMSCLRYELKNSFFKRCSHIVCNFKDICFTLAYRHQQYALQSRISNVNVRNFVIVARHHVVPVCSLPYSETLCQFFGIDSTDDIAVTYKIARASVDCRAGQHFVVDEFEGDLVFGRAESFVSIQGDSIWHIVFSSLQTIAFDDHYHGFNVMICEPPTYRVMKLEELLDYHPVVCHNIRKNNLTYARLHYHVFHV